MQLIHIIIKGTSPLLVNRFRESSEIEKATRRVVVKRGSPREEATKVAYIDEEQRFYYPATAIARLLRESASNHKMKGSRRSAKYAVPGAIFLTCDTLLIRNGDGKTLVKDFEVDSRPVVIPATKGRIMCHRPRFEDWSCSFDLRLNEELLPSDFVHQLLTEGGQQIGIGSFRPEKGGPFGTFNVVHWEMKDSPNKPR